MIVTEIADDTKLAKIAMFLVASHPLAHKRLWRRELPFRNSKLAFERASKIVPFNTHLHKRLCSCNLVWVINLFVLLGVSASELLVCLFIYLFIYFILLFIYVFPLLDYMTSSVHIYVIDVKIADLDEQLLFAG